MAENQPPRSLEFQESMDEDNLGTAFFLVSFPNVMSFTFNLHVMTMFC